MYDKLYFKFVLKFFYYQNFIIFKFLLKLQINRLKFFSIKNFIKYMNHLLKISQN